MNKSCFLLLFIFVLQIYSCKKSTTGNSSQPSGPNVYVAGAEAGNPAYWKNDSDWFLTGAFSVSGIYVSGNDVYVAGEVTDGNGAETYYGITNKAAYWKNDSLVTVSDGSTHVQVNSIFVSGNDVYVAGTVAGTVANGFYTFAEYWKNGNPVMLSDTSQKGEDEANSIFVSGNDVYVAGNGAGLATYWKNGNPVLLSDSSQGADANSIFVSGNDVYVAGIQYGGEFNGAPYYFAEYWKNGNLVMLSDSSQKGDDEANSIFVSGNDVYVAGKAAGLATYWKNGISVTLSDGFRDATSLYVFGNDVYVAGTSGSGEPQYWKNGNLVTLSNGGPGSTTSIFVK